MHNQPERPDHQARLIAVMQESNVPPADADSPPIPADLLESLEERYGRTEPAPRRAAVEEKPGFWAQLMALFARPQFAVACAAVLLVGVGVFLLNEDLRGGGKPKPVTLPVYWASKTVPEPVALGLPTLIVIAFDQLPNKGNVIVFDPAQRTARLIGADGKPSASIGITDPADASVWLAAHRQLSHLANP